MELNEEFRQDSIADKETVIQYLELLRKGIESGSIELELKPEPVSFRPAGHVNMEIKAKRNDRHTRISLRLSWKDSEN